jgi:adenylate cyclase
VNQRQTFGSFEIRPAERQLLVEGTPASLGARAFDVLMALVERRERVVSREELIELVWPHSSVDENNLSVQISALRRVLGAAAITTVTGRGYQFTLGGEAESTSPEEPAPQMADRLQRRLTAIAAASVVDWAQWMSRDPQEAVSTWQRFRRSWVEPKTAALGGRIIELTADGLLAEFESAVDALNWAAALLDSLGSSNGGAGSQLRMRVGLAVDDVVIDEGRPLGGGVHHAVKLASLAQASQVVVTDVARTLTQGKLSATFTPIANGTGAEAQSETQPLWLVQAAGLATDVRQVGLAARQRGSVAVLPFHGEPLESERYYGDGITEEIISSLSLNRSLLVISRASTLRYRDSLLAPTAIAAELGVRYLLGGTVRRHQRQLRITAELIDAGNSRVIWSERYEGVEEELFDFQRRIASSIAAAIDPRVREAEVARNVSVPTEHLGAYDCLLRGLSLMNTFRGNDFAAAGDLFRRAIRLDPHFAQAHAQLAWWHNLRFGEGLSPAQQEDGRMAEALSLRAVELDGGDAVALSVAAHVRSFVGGRPAEAMEIFAEALAINPSCTLAWSRSGTTCGFMGRAEEALQRVATAIRLSPFDPVAFTFNTTSGNACMQLGRYGEAVSWLGKARRLNPGYRAATRLLVAALALSGEEGEAEAVAQELLSVEPTFRVSVFGSWYPMCEPHKARLLDAMRAGGLPN